MPYGQTDLEAFVKELGLPADKAKAVLDAIGADGAVLGKFGEHVLRQSDYSAKMNELQTEKQRLEADFQRRQREEDEFHKGLTNWKTEEERKANEQISRATQEAEARLNTVRAKVRELATRNGIPEEEIKDLVTAPATVVTETRRADPPRNEDGTYMRTDEFQRQSRFFARLPGLQLTLNEEYRRLFGFDAPTVNWEKVIGEAETTFKTSQQPLLDAFNTIYKIPEKRQELQKAAHDKEIEDAKKAGAEAERSKILAENPQMSVRTVDRERPGSPILGRARAQQEEDAKTGTPPAKEHGPVATVNAAVQAFNEGRYKSGQAA